MLFFAYGGTSQVHVFLQEATAAALSIRRLNPTLNIGVVTNNATVDRAIFTHHITPRSDLIFPGAVCSDACRPDKLQRQWTTRVLYMAYSPFEITWAMDSNVYACPGPSASNAVHKFLLAAESTDLWGYDIAHANLARGSAIFPHLFSLVWRWTPATSNVFRDWFMLMLRRGLAKSDQEPLRIAEARQLAAGGLRLGQVPTEFALAMNSAFLTSFWPRVTRPLQGAARIVHSTPLPRKHGLNGPAFCAAANADVGVRRQLAHFTEAGAPPPLPVLRTEAECMRALNTTKPCPFGNSGMRRHPEADGELLETRGMGLAGVIKKLHW